MIVKLIGPGLKLKGNWYFKNDEVEIEKDEYEGNEEYLKVIKVDNLDEEAEEIEEVVDNLDEEAEEIEEVTDNLDEETKKLSMMKFTDLMKLAKSKNVEIVKGSNKDAIIKAIIQFDNGETDLNPEGE